MCRQADRFPIIRRAYVRDTVFKGAWYKDVTHVTRGVG